jgi:c-di-GMP-related signal transduction protein
VPDEYIDAFKANQTELKDILSVMEFYSQKHYERAERNLKKSYYTDYVLSQLTL